MAEGPEVEFMRSEADGDVLVVTLDRADKRNALSAAFIEEIVSLFDWVRQAEAVRAVVVRAEGSVFCAGLDLIEHHLEDRSATDFMYICRRWHAAFDAIQHCGKPVIGALNGAVVGGGLELASAFHIRVADQTTYFALPEGQRGIFTGGGATVRVARLVGEARMIDMMLTGRVYTREEAVSVGLCQYLVEGSSMDKAMEIARKLPKIRRCRTSRSLRGSPISATCRLMTLFTPKPSSPGSPIPSRPRKTGWRPS